jgi:sorting nexin-8
LWDVLVRRYPFRLLPALPPKRIGRGSIPLTNVALIELLAQRMTTFWNREGWILFKAFKTSLNMQCRRGLARFLNFVVNHPIIKEDGVLSVFLTEPSFEHWRKHSSVSFDEESTGKRIERVEEMTIPSDLDDKLQ